MIRGPVTLHRWHQRGSALIVAMLFLIVLSLFAVSSYVSSTGNTIVTGNMVARQEALAAAQWLLDDTISSTTFATNPNEVAAGSYEIDLDGDLAADYHPRLDPAPQCQRSRALKSVQLDPSDEGDLACMVSGVVHHSGLDTPDLAAATGDSLCASTEWNVRAVTEDERTGVFIAANQGVGVRVLTTEANEYCF